jgi:tRNA1(Val) A37 N6-methylase TrmN6
MIEGRKDSAHETARLALEGELGEEVTCDALTRDFVMFQRRRGHRYSTDDLLTAWYAVTHLWKKTSMRLLDLGAGIGSIGLTVLWAAEDASLTAIEAQELSYRFLRANVEANGVGRHTNAIHGDLRHASHLSGAAPFDLITGSPPYFDVKAGIVSADSQRAHARFELRGDVRDYARSAAQHLAEDGVFVLCFPTVQRARAEEACEAAGLVGKSVRDVVPRRGLPPLFTLFAYTRPNARAEPRMVEPPFVVREADGTHTPELLAVQKRLGLGPYA